MLVLVDAMLKRWVPPPCRIDICENEALRVARVDGNVDLHIGFQLQFPWRRLMSTAALLAARVICSYADNDIGDKSLVEPSSESLRHDDPF
jgi:hypothetical protein